MNEQLEQVLLTVESLSSTLPDEYKERMDDATTRIGIAVASGKCQQSADEIRQAASSITSVRDEFGGGPISLAMTAIEQKLVGMSK